MCLELVQVENQDAQGQVPASGRREEPVLDPFLHHDVERDERRGHHLRHRHHLHSCQDRPGIQADWTQNVHHALKGGKLDWRRRLRPVALLRRMVSKQGT